MTLLETILACTLLWVYYIGGVAISNLLQFPPDYEGERPNGLYFVFWPLVLTIELFMLFVISPGHGDDEE